MHSCFDIYIARGEATKVVCGKNAQQRSTKLRCLLSTHCVSVGERVPQHSAWRVKVNHDGYCTHTENTSVLSPNLTRHVYGFGSGAETNIRICLHVQYTKCQYIIVTVLCVAMRVLTDPMQQASGLGSYSRLIFHDTMLHVGDKRFTALYY